LYINIKLYNIMNCLDIREEKIMDKILGLNNLQHDYSDVLSITDEWYDEDDWHSENIYGKGYIIYYFAFAKTKMKQFEEYLDLSWASDSDKQLILNSTVSEFSLCDNEDKITFQPRYFDDVYATISQDVLNSLMKLVNNK